MKLSVETAQFLSQKLQTVEEADRLDLALGEGAGDDLRRRGEERVAELGRHKADRPAPLVPQPGGGP
ncbi:hypothetical protein [Actinomadura sp.]|uniref:hypothetical protein n=1 Tax=Actinomadura sp. TaxID=1989 RepID=UPI0037C7D7AC